MVPRLLSDTDWVCGKLYEELMKLALSLVVCYDMKIIAQKVHGYQAVGKKPNNIRSKETAATAHSLLRRLDLQTVAGSPTVLEYPPFPA